jgi:hypothetical protein
MALGANIIGVRTAVCTGGKRSGPLSPERVRNLKASLTRSPRASPTSFRSPSTPLHGPAAIR